MYQDGNGMTLDYRLLNLLDLADAHGVRLSLPSVMGIMRAGYRSEDFETEEGVEDADIPLKSRRAILELLYRSSSEERRSAMERDSLYLLAIPENGLSESIVRNLLYPAGIRFEQIPHLEYESFKSLTGGRERIALYKKMIGAFESAGGVMAIETGKVERKKKPLSDRAMKQIENTLLSSYDDVSDFSSLEEWAEATGLDGGSLEEGLERLSMKGYLEKESGWVRKRIIPLEEAMARLDEQEDVHVPVLRSRLQGETLGEISEAQGYSRARAGQIISKAMMRLPVTHIVEARRTRRLFERYAIDVSFFEHVFLEAAEVYRFLVEKCVRGTRDKRDAYLALGPEEKKRMLEHENLMEDQRGLPVVISKNGAIELYFARRGREQKRIDLHHEGYMEFIREEFDDREQVVEALTMTKRNFEAISERLPCCIQSSKRCFRYFDFSRVLEEQDFIRELLRLEPGVYSSRIVYEGNMEYFMSLDVRDYHELHNIMRDKMEIDFVEMRRMPEFSIGVKDKFEWLLLLIGEMGPIKLDHFVEFLERKYGLHAPSTRSLIQMELSDYITPEKVLHHDFTELTPAQREFIEGILRRDIYTMDELVDANSRVEDFTHLYLNNRVLNSVGYVLSGGFVVRETYGSGEKYFRRALLAEDYYKTERSDIENTQSFWKVVQDLQRSLDLFRIGEHQYMNITVLERAGFTKDVVDEFRRRVTSHFGGGRYYTVKNVRDEVAHPLLEAGFEDIFYSRILRTGERVQFIPLAAGDILYQATERRNQTDFLMSEIDDGMEMNALLARVDEKYGIKLDFSKTIEIIKASRMYYMPEMGKIFVDKESFLERIYTERG